MAKASAPWDKSNPKEKAGKSAKKLTPAKKAAAKSMAKRAGRPYPNLVDNMRAAAGKTHGRKTARKAAKETRKSATKKSATKKTATKKAATKKASKKTARKTATKRTTRSSASDGDARKDPGGGLTAKGRAWFAKTQGARLKPGVTKPQSDMSPKDMRRKGSWAVRFYGRDPLPPLVDDKGEPTRLALSAHAWGEPVPKTEAAARRIAAKGRRLLERYRAAKED